MFILLILSINKKWRLRLFLKKNLKQLNINQIPIYIPRLSENAKHLSLEAVNTEPPDASYFRKIRLIRYNAGRKTKEVERVFQAFLLGMLIRLTDRYEVYSEKESGYGRFDVSVIPKDKNKQAIIMELKSIDTFNNETKDQTLEAALKQIEDRRYEAAIRQQGCTNIMKVAVTFDGKRVWAKTNTSKNREWISSTGR